MKVWRMAAVFVVLAGSACSGENEGLPRARVRVASAGGKELVVAAEVAETPRAREIGLMNRPSLGEMEGMIFVWPEVQRNVFWMKNTLIPLDMIFVEGGKVVAIEPDAKPMDETPIDPGVDSDAVLEVKGGWAARHGVRVGDGVVVE